MSACVFVCLCVCAINCGCCSKMCDLLAADVLQMGGGGGGMQFYRSCCNQSSNNDFISQMTYMYRPILRMAIGWPLVGNCV